MSPNHDTAWHLDKKVPLGIIVTIILQTMVFIWWFSSWQENVNGRLTALEAADATRATHENRIVVLEQKLNFIVEGISEIKASVRQIAQDQKDPKP